MNISTYKKFEERIKKENIKLFAYEVIKGDETVYKKYFEGHAENELFRLYSVTKSFVSLAIGFLLQDNVIKLDDKIIDYFPEYVNENTHEFLKALTIRQMLMMSTCHYKTTYKRVNEQDFTKTFFTVTPEREPGGKFSYDTSSSHTLGRLVEKLTNKNLLDFLRDKCLDKIGFSKEAYMLKDPVGTSDGGSGLYATLDDLSKLSILIKNDGLFNGKQLINREYLNSATSLQIKTENQKIPEQNLGYGYFFWVARNNGICMYGMGGQLALIFKEKNLIFTCTGDCEDSLQKLYDIFYDTIYKE